jgi:NAD(P)H-hydrate epimerase
MREADRLAEGRFHIPPLLLMEHAAIGVAREAMVMLARRRGGGHLRAERVLIVCGPGNNGGDGLGAARLLTLAGRSRPGRSARASGGATAPLRGTIEVRVLLAMPVRACTALCAAQLAMVRALGVPIAQWRGDARALRSPKPDLIIDAIFGTGLSRPLPTATATLVETINAARASTGAPRVLSIDVPTGMDADTGLPPQGREAGARGVMIEADRTVVLAALKAGLIRKDARAFTGSLVVADIGMPDSLLGGHALHARGGRDRMIRTHGAESGHSGLREEAAPWS